MDSEIPFATLDTEAAALSPWLNAFERFFGQSVQVTTDDEPGQRLTCPRVFQHIELIGSAHHLKMHPAVLNHVRRLGFEWESDGRILTVPTPATFNVRMEKYGQPDAGYRIAWVTEHGGMIALGPWLHRYMRGILTVQAYTQKFVDDILKDGPKGLFARPLVSVLPSLIHDLSVHALNYHLIPHAALADMAERIQKAVPERVESWKQPGVSAPLTLSYFYDNDLNRYAYAVWCRTQKPEEFRHVFMKPQSYEQLLAALDVRLQETLAGIGDVPSGQVEDMKQPMQPTKFDIP